MKHPTQDELYAYAFGDEEPTSDLLAHLENCQECRAEVDELTALASALSLARASEPSSSALEAYRAIFDEYGPGRLSTLARTWTWIVATLTSDSRVQPLAALTRSVRAGSYRLLYDSPSADIELFIEGDGETRRIHGDVIAAASDDRAIDRQLQMGGALVQLHANDNPTSFWETYTDIEGQFQFESVPVGSYRLMITSRSDDLLQVSELNVT